MKFTAEQKFQEAAREVNFRRRVYERLIGEGSMKREEAQRRIDIMSQIAEDYRTKAELEAPQLKFPDSY